MIDEEHEFRWSNDAVKDWAFALLVNAPFPLVVLMFASFTGQFRIHPNALWYGLGVVGAVALVFAAGIPFAGRESRIFTRVIDGVYVLALGQLFPIFQFVLICLCAGIWNYSVPSLGIARGDYPLLASYFIGFVYCQLSLVVSFFLGCAYRKPRGYPKWLRPWNHEFDRINDTLTRR